VSDGLELFLRSLGRALADSAAATRDADTAAGIRRVASLAQSITFAAPVRPAATPTRLLPVCRFWGEAIASATRAGSSLAGSLAVFAPSLSWTQNPNYRREPPDAGFLDHYGYAVIVGPTEGPPALAVDSRLALGVLLLGPGTHYPLHSHPAIEVYYTLTEEGEWWREAGPWRSEPSGSTIYHAPNVPHATRTQSRPLLAIYLWQGDLETHASLHPAVPPS
jgi:hypothetical protein